ncbi:MAG: HAD hydrolase-like protein [bacterium]
MALERTGHPQHRWMVGDSLEADVEGAERQGSRPSSSGQEPGTAGSTTSTECSTYSPPAPEAEPHGTYGGAHSCCYRADAEV